MSVQSVNQTIESLDDLLELSNNICQETKDRLLSCGINYKTDSKRLLLIANRARADMGASWVRKCNGLILCQGRVIAQPPELLSHTPSHKHVKANWGKYQQFRIYDGTLVTIYYYENQWCIATTNGYEVNNYKWGTGSSYEEIMSELFGRWDIYMDSLDTSLNYTFNIKHSSIHPFRKDPDGIILIQAHRGGEPVPRTALAEKLQMMMPIAEPATDYRVMMRVCRDALSEHLANPKYVHYGFILRSADDLGADTNVLFESTLLKKIRQLAYNIPKGKLRPSDPHAYAALRAYLNYTQRAIFRQLFPQIAETFTEYDVIFKKAADKLMAVARNPTTRCKLLEKRNDIVDEIAFSVMADVERMENINMYDSTSNRILYDVVVDGKYLNTYYRILVSERALDTQSLHQ